MSVWASDYYAWNFLNNANILPFILICVFRKHAKGASIARYIFVFLVVSHPGLSQADSSQCVLRLTGHFEYLQSQFHL